MTRLQLAYINYHVACFMIGMLIAQFKDLFYFPGP